ncbi:MAG: hypothetical protein ACR2KX_09930 [Chitinophagaceae bacterium]
MRKLILVLIALPFFSFAQEKNVVSVDRLFPKADKINAFEKALTAHAQKYHTGTWKWRVFTVETGPESGGYQITEGPMSWDDLDTRGDLGKAHQDDYAMNITPLLTDKGYSSYSLYRADLSSVALTEYSNKIAINHVFPKPGYGGDMEDVIKNLKKMWDASGQTVAVYEASSSGPPQYSIVTRYKQGLKERNTGFRKPMRDRYVEANGQNSWEEFTKGQRNTIDHSWSEMLFYHPELSSK